MPYETYNHSTGATAVIGGPFYNATAYPQYRGNYFYADYTGNFIKRVVFDVAHNPVGIQTFATNVAAPVSLAVGPDGFIYYLSFTTGDIRRIRPSGPAAAATATPRYGMSPLTVSFSAGTTNPAGGALTYNWTFGDGTTSTQANPHVHGQRRPDLHRHTQGHRQRRRVLDRHGRCHGEQHTARPHHQPAARRHPGGAGPDGDIPGLGERPRGWPAPAERALSWTILLHHNTHVHTFVGGSGSSGSFVAENHGSIGTYSYEIVLTATDSSGLSTSRSINLPVISDTTPPSAPSALTATANGAGRIDLAWQAATDDNSIAGYQVERCQVPPARTSCRCRRRQPARACPTPACCRRRRTATACGPPTRWATSATTRTSPAPRPSTLRRRLLVWWRGTRLMPGRG